MRTAGLRPLLYLTGRWLAAASSRRSSIILGVTFALLAAVYVCVNSFTLSAQQEVDKSFGSYQQSTFTNVTLGDLDSGFLARANSALDEAVPRSHVSIESSTLRPDSFTKTFVQGPIPVTRFVQDPGLRQAFPGRYTLEQGSWPSAPSDVVVSRHLYEALPDHDQFTMLSGRAKLHIVGVVEDAYAQHDDLIVAGAGTWQSFPTAAPGHSYQPTDAQVFMRLGGDASFAKARQALTTALPPKPTSQRDHADYLNTNRTTRSQVAGEPVAQFGAEGQLIVSYLPLGLVVVVVSALVVGQTRREHRDNAARLVALGVRRGRVRLSQVVALCTVTAGSIIVGLGAGWLLALGLRAGVLPNFANQPLSPISGIDATALGVSAVSLVIVAAGVLWPEDGAFAAPRRALSRYLAEIHVAAIRRVLIVLLIIVALRAGGQVIAAYLTVAAVLLASPDVLRFLVSALPRRNPRTAVIGRLMSLDRGAQAAAVIVVAGCLAVPISAGTQLASTYQTQQDLRYTVIPHHQVWVQSSGDTDDVDGVAATVSDVPGLGPPVATRDLEGPPGPHGRAGAQARFVKPSNGGNALMVLTSAEQLRRLLGEDMPSRAASVLNNGGVVDFSSLAGDQRLAVYADGGRRQSVTPALPTLHMSPGRQFNKQAAGVVLLSTAQNLNLPISPPKTYIFPDASSEQIDQAVAAAVDAGYDSEFVQYAVTPPPPDLPTSAYVFLAALILGGFAILLLVIRGQARRLRSYSARLVALGLRPRWTLSLLAIQAGLVVAVGVVMGIGAGILGVEITANSYTRFDVPLPPILLACGLTIIAAGLATILAARALTAAEHPTVT